MTQAKSSLEYQMMCDKKAGFILSSKQMNFCCLSGDNVAYLSPEQQVPTLISNCRMLYHIFNFESAIVLYIVLSGSVANPTESPSTKSNTSIYLEYIAYNTQKTY